MQRRNVKGEIMARKRDLYATYRKMNINLSRINCFNQCDLVDWRGVGVAYRAGFENQCARQSTGGSNPPLSGFLLSAKITSISSCNSMGCVFSTIFARPVALKLPLFGVGTLLRICDLVSSIMVLWLSSSWMW